MLEGVNLDGRTEIQGKYDKTSGLFTAILVEMYIAISMEMEGSNAVNAETTILSQTPAIGAGHLSFVAFLSSLGTSTEL